MERLPAGVAISVAAHAAVIAFALWRLDDCQDPPREVPPPVVIEVVPATPAPEPEPMAVVVLDDEAIAAALPAEPPAPEPLDRRTRERTTAAIATTAPRATEAAATATTTQPGTDGAGPTRNPLLTMRGTGRPDPAAIDLRLRPGFRDALEHAPAGTDPARPVETGKLQPSGGGTYRSDEGVFTARVDKDGSVSIKDSKNFRVSVKLPKPKQLGRAVGQWYESDKGPDGKRGARTLEDKVTGSIDGEDRSQAVIVPVIGGGFDVTDALLRRKKQDPYFSKKLAYLDSTRDERAAIGTRHRKDQLAQAARIMQKHVDGVWARTADPAARRQALFELWDDCAETGEPALVEAGTAARTFVLGVIRSRFPAGSANAYTTAELATLNGRRRSRVAFAPY